MKHRRRIPGRDREVGGAARCRRRACDTLMTPEAHPDGSVTFVCAPCQRNAAGFCRDCPAPLPLDTHPYKRAPQRLRCDGCTRKHNNKRRNALYHVDVERHRAIKRRSSKRPHVRERQRRAVAEWRKKHPLKGDPFAQAYARHWMRRKLSDPQVRAAVNARRRERAAQKRAAVVAAGQHKRLYPKPFGPKKQPEAEQRLAS